MHILSQKSTPPKTFYNIFTQAKYISVKFLVASLYPHILTNFGRFILFNNMVLIFIGVLIVFAVSSFQFQQVRLAWLHR